jgi:hypothetical protein
VDPQLLVVPTWFFFAAVQRRLASSSQIPSSSSAMHHSLSGGNTMALVSRLIIQSYGILKEQSSGRNTGLGPMYVSTIAKLPRILVDEE